jgi:hypothetical protein
MDERTPADNSLIVDFDRILAIGPDPHSLNWSQCFPTQVPTLDYITAVLNNERSLFTDPFYSSMYRDAPY